jgi:hypothetical protein
MTTGNLISGSFSGGATLRRQRRCATYPAGRFDIEENAPAEAGAISDVSHQGIDDSPGCWAENSPFKSKRRSSGIRTHG